MKLTKEQWKQLSDRIFLTLRPTQHPVAMKFIKTPEEFDAIPDIEFCQNKASTCKLIGMAAHFQGTFGLTPDHFSDSLAEITKREKGLVAALKAMLGIYAQVHLVSPKSIARSEGKAIRVIDKRKI